MSLFDPLFESIVDAVTANELLGDTFAGRTDWLDWGLPPEPGTDGLPCVRVQLLGNNLDRQNSYSFQINLWGDYDGSTAAMDDFIALSEALQDALDTISAIESQGYLPRPEPQNGINRSLYQATYYA